MTGADVLIFWKKFPHICRGGDDGIEKRNGANNVRLIANERIDCKEKAAFPLFSFPLTGILLLLYIEKSFYFNDFQRSSPILTALIFYASREDAMVSRREFLMTLARLVPMIGGAGIFLSGSLWENFLFGSNTGILQAMDRWEDIIRSAPTARYWTSPALGKASCLACHSAGEHLKTKDHAHEEQIVKCLLCAQDCIIRAGRQGRCRARMNVGGELKSLVYGRPITVHVDPIEKKPFYHYLPGSQAYSLATSGCPLQCKFCQNWEISQAAPEDYQVSPTPPSSIVSSALSHGAPVIAFTYNEPTVFSEYLIDIAEKARKRKIHPVLVSCGIMNEKPLADMCKFLDAIKIDLKGYSEDFYRKVCRSELRPVLRSIKQIAKSQIHLEIVNLVVPTLNDSDKMIEALVEWVIGEIGPDVPVHFTRFQPNYQLLNLPPTPVATLDRARQIALSKGIHYAYVGNVPDHPGNHTYCPFCKKIVIKRTAFFLTEVNIKKGRCAYCHKKIAGVWT